MMTDFDDSLSERTDSRVAQFLAVPRVEDSVEPSRRPFDTFIRICGGEENMRYIGQEEARKLVASNG